MVDNGRYSFIRKDGDVASYAGDLLPYNNMIIGVEKQNNKAQSNSNYYNIYHTKTYNRIWSYTIAKQHRTLYWRIKVYKPIK